VAKRNVMELDFTPRPKEAGGGPMNHADEPGIRPDERRPEEHGIDHDGAVFPSWSASITAPRTLNRHAAPPARAVLRGTPHGLATPCATRARTKATHGWRASGPRVEASANRKGMGPRRAKTGKSGSSAFSVESGVAEGNGIPTSLPGKDPVKRARQGGGVERFAAIPRRGRTGPTEERRGRMP
jgi:hypothetical protein